MSGTPGGTGSHTGARARAWWWALVLVAIALVAVAWAPWQHGPAIVAPPVASSSAAADDEAAGGAGPAPAPSPTASKAPAEPAPTPGESPDASVTETTNTSPPAPNVPTGIFTDETAQGLFLSAEQLAAAVPAASDAAAPPEYPAPVWGLPAGGSVVPAECLLAVVVADRPPLGYAARTMTGQQVDFRQDVVLLAGPVNARHAFASLVGAVDACPEYREGAADGSGVTWQTQPAIEGQGLFPSIVQEVGVDDGSGTVRHGYRGHLLVGNAIVTWTVRTPGPVDALGPPDALADVVQDRALAAVRALG